jgi:hypothetical protein
MRQYGLVQTIPVVEDLSPWFFDYTITDSRVRVRKGLHLWECRNRETADSCAVHTAKLMELLASRVRDLYCSRSGIEGEGKDSMTGRWLVHEGCMINTYRKHENAVNGLLRLTYKWWYWHHKPY